MSPGQRESQWLILRRCLAIIRRAQRGPTDWRGLVQAVRKQEGSDAYGEAEGEALHRRLENDLQRIRNRLYVDLYFDRRSGGYAIRDTWTPLLDMPDEDVAVMAWLEQTFGPDSPQHDEVQDLLGRLRSYLPGERRAEMDQCRSALTVELQRRDEDEIRPTVWADLCKAQLERRRIEMRYLSPQYEDGRPRCHVVDPLSLFFDPARGHYYLRAYCRRVEEGTGWEEVNRYILYRVGRILEVRVSPQKMPQAAPAAPRYRVEYELTARVARLGITRQPGIEIKRVEQREDGSVLVRGQTEDVFWAVQSLLHYGPNCRVLGGPEMVGRMRETVLAMAEMYREQHPPHGCGGGEGVE